jgi:hypothetical protein
VFVDPDKRGDATLEDAKEIKAKLVAMGEDAASKGAALGDRFMLQNYYPERTQAEIRKLFGSGFAQSLFELEPGDWRGPLLSGYGTHLVLVHDLIPAPDADFTAVKQRVLQDWGTKKREEFNQKFTEGLLSRYEIIVELEDENGNIEEISLGMEKQNGEQRTATDGGEVKTQLASREGDNP